MLWLARHHHHHLLHHRPHLLHHLHLVRLLRDQLAVRRLAARKLGLQGGCGCGELGGVLAAMLGSLCLLLADNYIRRENGSKYGCCSGRLHVDGDYPRTKLAPFFDAQGRAQEVV